MFHDPHRDNTYPLLSRLADPLKAAERVIVGRDHEKMQLMAAMSRAELCNALLLAEAGTGKLLPLDTLIPTPTGWTTMGDLQPGDKVLGRDGKPTTVTYVSEVNPEPVLYDIEICEDYAVTACADHQWRVVMRPCGEQDDKRLIDYDEYVVTTQYMVDHYDEYDFHIRRHAPFDLDNATLPLDPYALGLYLGNVYYDYMGMGSSKHIPIEYLRASHEQRLSLLRGLIDGQYYDDDHPQNPIRAHDANCTLYFKSQPLFNETLELLDTLGIDWECCGGSEEESEFEIDINTNDLHRSINEWLPSFYGITDITPASSRPGKCIQVDNDDHMYLCGRDFIPTHNTALVQATMAADTNRLYLEVDPARMIAESGTPEAMASMLKGFFDEAERFVADERQELVLFIDEFHQIIQLSSASVEAIKPVLAASGARGIRIIAATTFEEFHKHIAPNQPLVERLQRINLNPPNQKTTITILQGMAERYGVADQFVDDHIFQQIYEYTERYMPASSQPRKSILILDAMVGWHRLTHRPMDRDLLADVLQESLNVNISFTVDGAKIKEQLDARVFSQDLATSAVARRLQLSVADLHDPSKPMASLLFTGSTGVGKTELTKQLATLLFGDDSRHLIRFDMTEYASDDTLAAFRSELTKRVWDRSHSVVLFDEIEKASPMVTRLLLQVLDDGRLSDDNHREVSFLNTYIVLTTNAGSEIYKDIARYAEDNTGSGKLLEQYKKLIRRSIATTTAGNRFPPELLGRIDAIVPFQPLSLATQQKIVRSKLLSLVKEVYVKHNVRVDVDESVLAYLTEDKGESDSDAGGARAAVAKMTEEVTTSVAAFINEHPGVRQIGVTVVGDLVSQNKNLLTSDAHVVVAERV